MCSVPRQRDSETALHSESVALRCSSPIPALSPRAPPRRRKLGAVSATSPRIHPANLCRILRPPFRSCARRFLGSGAGVMGRGAIRATVCRALRHQVQDCLVSYQIDCPVAIESFITLPAGWFARQSSKPDFPFAHDQILRWGEHPISPARFSSLLYRVVKDRVLAGRNPSQSQQPD